MVKVQALTAQQFIFKKAYAKALQGEVKAVETAKKQLQGYRLSHYLDYALIKASMKSLPDVDITVFIDNNQDSPLVDSLNDMYTYELGKQKKWTKYLQRYKNNRKSQNMHCWYLQARIETKKTTGLPQAISDTWMSGLSLPDSCNSVFVWWENQGHLNDKLLLERIKLAFKVNNASTARYLVGKLKKTPAWTQYALSLMKDPVIALKAALAWQDNSVNRELVYLKAKMMASKKPNVMYPLWGKLKKHFTLSEKQKAVVDRKIALFAATDYLPFTITAMDELPSAQHDAQINAWKVRYHLYNHNWADVIDTINKMPAFQRKKDSWQYWMGRALAKTQKQTKAKTIFTQLSKKSSYYGFLAADHMRLPYALCNEDITSEKINVLPENLENSFELFALDMIALARKEWIIGYRKLSNGQRRELANIAYEKGWYNKVSAIMGALGLWKNYKMRYPLAYLNEITELANEHRLLPQWIMSIITQESAWQTDAISRADARGLMQIIDPTAKRLSKQLGVSYSGKQQLHNANFNLKLGIFYQRKLFDEFSNHPLLALASYNAGESKANDWLSKFPTSPDIWAETIPYRETRDYIAKILTNITIYDWLINQKPRRISSWMPTFPVDGEEMKQWPNNKTSQQTVSVGCQQ